MSRLTQYLRAASLSAPTIFIGACVTVRATIDGLNVPQDATSAAAVYVEILKSSASVPPLFIFPIIAGTLCLSALYLYGPNLIYHSIMTISSRERRAARFAQLLDDEPLRVAREALIARVILERGQWPAIMPVPRFDERAFNSPVAGLMRQMADGRFERAWALFLHNERSRLSHDEQALEAMWTSRLSQQLAHAEEMRWQDDPNLVAIEGDQDFASAQFREEWHRLRLRAIALDEIRRSLIEQLQRIVADSGRLRLPATSIPPVLRSDRNAANP